MILHFDGKRLGLEEIYGSLDDLRQVTRCSIETQIFEPHPNDRWEEAYDQVRQLNACGGNL